MKEYVAATAERDTYGFPLGSHSSLRCDTILASRHGLTGDPSAYTCWRVHETPASQPNRRLQFRNVSEQVFSHLENLWREHSARCEMQRRGDEMRGRAEHMMGAIEFVWRPLEQFLEIVILWTNFVGSLIIGGIRQHVEEAIEAVG